MKNNIEKGIYIPDEQHNLVPVDEWVKRDDPTTAQTVVLVTDFGALEIAKEDLPGEFNFEDAQKAAAEYREGFRCPTRHEAIEMYDARFRGLDEAFKKIGGKPIDNDWRWTSEADTDPEYNSNNAFIYNGNTGNVNNNNKYNTYAVRPVSEFQDNVDPFAPFYKSMRAAYRLCLKNKAHTANAIRFWFDEESALVALAREVFNCEYVPRQSIAFIVTKPCLREVVAADFRDRIVQHFIVMRLEPLFDACGTLDKNMFSCRVGKGNLAAIQALQRQIFDQSKGYTADCYVAKFDLQSFFMSIDKRRLYDELVALVSEHYEGQDKDTLLYLIRIVTLHNPQDNALRKTPLCDWADLPRSKSLYNVDWFLGLAIGNLTSQSDANFYNAPAMRWMRSIGLVPVNYVDDFAFVVRDKVSFLTAMPHIRDYFATERGLTMHPRKFYLQHYSKGIKFLGAVIKYNRIYTNNQTVARCLGKIHYYNETCRHSSRRKVRHVEKLATILNSYLGLMRHFDTFNIRKRIAAEVGTVWRGYIRFDDDITTATVVKRFRQREICKYNVRKQRRRDLFTLKNLLNNGNTAAN